MGEIDSSIQLLLLLRPPNGWVERRRTDYGPTVHKHQQQRRRDLLSFPSSLPVVP